MMDNKEKVGHILRMLRPYTQVGLFVFIVVVEIPFLTFLCLQGASSLGSEEFLTFMRNYRTTVYGGTIQFSLGDILSGNLWLLYVSCGVLVAILSGWRLARHFQYRDFKFFSKAAAKPQYVEFLRHPEVRALTLTSRTKPEWGNVIRGLLWAVAFVPIWPLLVWWAASAEVPEK